MRVLALFLHLIIIQSAFAQNDVTSLAPLQVKSSEDDLLSTLEETENQEASAQRDFAEKVVLLPNISRSGGSHRSRYLQIRGLGDRGQFEQLQMSAVGVFYDGIDLSEEASVMPLGYGEHLTVNYGPQSLQWGGKALAGSIESAFSYEPRENFSFLETAVDSNRSLRLQTSNQLVWGRTTAKLGGSFFKSDGYFKNVYLDQPTHKQNEKNLLVSLRSRFARSTLEQTHLLAFHDNGYDAWSFNNGFETLSDHPGRDRHGVNGHSLRWKRGDEAGRPKFESLTSLTHTRQIESYDEDWANNDYWHSVSGWGQNYNYFSEFHRRRLKLHQKLMFRFSPADELGWHGSYYSESQLIHSFEDEAVRRTSHNKITSENHALWWKRTQRWENLRVDVGLRAENQRVRLAGDLPFQKKDFALWGSEVRLAHQSSENLEIYAVFRRGYRGGGFNTGVDLPVFSRAFSPEVLYELQLGSQYKTSDYEFATRIFHYWHDDQQIQTSQQSDPTDPSTFIYFTDNAARSRRLGLESGGSYFLGPHRFDVNLGVLHAQFRDYSFENQSLRGRDVPYAPRWSGMMQWRFEQPRWGSYVRLKGTDSFYYSEDHAFRSPVTWLSDAGFKVFRDGLEVEFSIENIFSQKHYTRAYYFANEPPLWEDKLYLQPGAPRTVSLRLSLFL